jgi:flagellar hook-length control protein FliK
MVGYIKSSGIENSISLPAAGDRGESAEFKSGGDFLSILKSSVEFKETRIQDRQESARNPDTDYTRNASDKTVQAVSADPAMSTRHENNPVKPEDVRETGNKPQPDRPEKTETAKKTDRDRGAGKEKNSGTDSPLSIAGDILAQKNINAGPKGKNEKVAALLNRESGKTFAAMMGDGDLSKVKINKDIPEQNKENLLKRGLSEVLESAVKGATAKRPIATKPERGGLNRNETAENTAAFTGTMVKGKLKNERGIQHQKHKPAEAAVSDKKSIESGEAVQQRQKLAGDQAALGKGAGSGSENNRDNSQLFTGKTESTARHVQERTESAAKMPEFRQSLQEIMDRARVTIRDNRNGSFTVKLFPKELGSVNVSLVMENGVVNGRFLVDNNDARTALLSNMENLLDDLQQSGVSVGEFSVNVRDEQKRFIRQNDEQKYRINPVITGSKEIVTAADVYDYNSVCEHNGSINMVI